LRVLRARGQPLLITRCRRTHARSSRIHPTRQKSSPHNKHRLVRSTSIAHALVPSKVGTVSGRRSSTAFPRLWCCWRRVRGRRRSAHGQQRAHDVLGLHEGRLARGKCTERSCGSARHTTGASPPETPAALTPGACTRAGKVMELRGALHLTHLRKPRLSPGCSDRKYCT